jgi:hypothetical protein
MATKKQKSRIGKLAAEWAVLDSDDNDISKLIFDQDTASLPSVQNSGQSNRTRNRNPFSLGKPAAEPDGPRSDCGPCAQCATHRREQPNYRQVVMWREFHLSKRTKRAREELQQKVRL